MATFDNEKEDEILARIQEESLRYYNEVELPRLAAEEALRDKQQSEPKHIPEPQPECSKTNNSVLVSQGTPVKDLFYQAVSQGAGGFHLATGDTYIYPTNYPVRKYQKNIIQSALFHNTLVSLPTGLGKTFIAAVVMFNYYRWFPQGKVVFMAPTRPLVAQQIRACHDIMAIPVKDTVEMTGTMNPVDRTQHWKSKRVFFLTPQVMANDLRSGICPAKSFKCVVIDEAHKATGEYAYCHVIKELENAGAVFRVLALSATPGSNIKAVIEVVQNLRITTLELRGEDSADVLPYTHTKQVEPTIVDLSKNIIDFREQYLLIFERYARSLRQVRLINCNVLNISKFQLLKASERLRSRPPQGMHKTKVGQMMSDFTVCMSLAHGLELLQTYGLRAFYQYFTGCEDEENRKAAFTRLRQDVEFHQLMEVLSRAISAPMNVYWSHPKHEKLVNILLEHFSQDEDKKSDSKVIIFCQYRVVVSEINELLTNIHPKVKPVMFIGQGVGKDKSGLPQKKQIEIMKQFREGRSNVLIATCVAEEGLDIGSVDLLVLMEVQRSPVRLIQRLGRTGRHRKGRCVVLLTRGKEVQKFHEAMATRKSFLDTIQSSKVLAGNLCRNEPLMFPPNLMPRMQLMHINVPERVTPGKSKKQSDIRQALVTRLSDTDEPDLESPYLTQAQADLVHAELGSSKLQYDSLVFTDSEYLFDKINGPAMSAEKLFSPGFCKQSEYNEWNRELHQTYLLSHSSDTDTLCELLSRVETPQSDINSQMHCSQLLINTKKPQKTKAKINPENETKKKKVEQGTRAGMDIRECMAAAADKARLTQQSKEKETAMSKPMVLDTVIDLECSSSDQPYPEVVVAENFKQHLDLEKGLSCSLCSELVRRVSILDEKPRKLTREDEEPFTLLELSAVGSLVENFTKDIIKSINIGEMFGGTMEFSMDNLKNSIAAIEESVKSIPTPNKELSSETPNLKRLHRTPPKTVSLSVVINKDNIARLEEAHFEVLAQDREGFDINALFEDESPPKQISTPKVCPKNQTKSGPSNVEFSPGCTEFFGIEDIFNDEDDMEIFEKVEKNTKTSTPNHKVKKITVTNPSQENSFSTNFLENKSIPLCSSNKAEAKKPFFKIPRLKLRDPCETVKTPISAKLPKSPIVFSSPESPILSGQVTQGLRHISPPKLERKALFLEDTVFSQKSDKKESLISDRDISFFCNPLDKTDASKSDATAKDDLNISISQLFDDDDDNVEINSSKNESKNSIMDQSSLYTITQMMNKVSEMNKSNNSYPNINSKKGNEANLDKRSKSEPENAVLQVDEKNQIDFGSSDEDSIFNNIDLDALEPVKKELKGRMMPPNAKGQVVFNGIDEALGSSKCLPTDTKSKAENISKEIIHETDQVCNLTSKSGANISIFKQSTNSTVSSRWDSCMKSPFNATHLKTPTLSNASRFKSSTPLHTTQFKSSTFHDCAEDLKLNSMFSDSDSNSSVFLSPLKNQSLVSEKPEKNRKIKKEKRQKAPVFVELEADVSGAPGSSDEENTSGLDDLDASFINDMSQQVNTCVNQTATDIQARYLQSVKSPIRKPGGFKIPTMSDTILGMDVFSQAVDVEDNDSYENDSFCCDDTEIPTVQDPSVLEIAERILKKKRQKKNRKKRKVVLKMDSSSDESNKLDGDKPVKRLLSSESSCGNSSTEDSVKRKRKRRKVLSSESSPESRLLKEKKEVAKKKPYLLTSESDSDKTDLDG